MSFWGTLAKVGGAAGGFMVGGPAGAMAGYSLGSAIGGIGSHDKTAAGGGSGAPSAGNAFNAATTQQQQYGAQDRTNYQDSRNRYMDALNGGQDAFNTSVQSAYSSAMPQFQQALQGTRESAVRRGISTGDLGTSNEGDLASAFQHNLTNSIGAQASQLYGQRMGGYNSMMGADQAQANSSNNNYLDMLSGTMDRQDAAKNRKQQGQNSLLGAVGSVGGAALGAYLGHR